ncbi:MAG: hypothetical protein ABI685_06500 [Ferruginibacter sp.]
MKNNRQFDEHIKEQFSNYQPDVPAHIWENIIAEKDRKRPAGFWVKMFTGRNKLLILALLIALSSGGAWIYFNRTSPSADLQTVAENSSSDNKKISSTETNQQDKQVTTPADVKSIIVNPATDNNATGTNKTLLSKTSTNTKISSPSLETDAENSTVKTVSKIKKQYTGLGNVLVNTTAPDLTEDEFEGGTLLGRLTYNAEKYTVKRISGKAGTLKFNPVIYLPGCPSIEKDAAGNKKYFEFYAGPDYGLRSLHDTANSTYLQQRKQSAQFKSGFSAGLRYTRVFRNSMSVRAGVNYSQINEKFTFNQGNIVQVTYIINANGDTVGSYTTTGSRHKTTINRYRSIDIPVVVGYELGNGKLHANINAGAIVNIYSWQQGDVLDQSGNPVSITTGKGSSPYQFKTNAGVGFIGAVSVYYKLTDRLHIMAEPYFRYNFSPMNKETITLKQKYQTAGLRLGIRLDLK